MKLIVIGLSLVLMQQGEGDAASDFGEAVEAARQADGGSQEAEQPTSIIVTGENEAAQKRVVVGSRIAKKPALKPTPIATATGSRGFTPGSGMDPTSQFTRVITTRECKSDHPAVRKQACRALASADKALLDGNAEEALFWMRHVSDWQSEYSPAERLIGAQRIFALGRDTDNPDLRLEALTDMLHTGEMAQAEQVSAARSAATIAMQQGKYNFAQLMLTQVIQMDPADAQSLANLAILQRRANDPAASATMRRAIDVREEAGLTAPKGWHDFAKADKEKISAD